MVRQLVCFLIFPQLLVFGTLDRIQKAMEKKEYDKAHELILKGLEKEPDNPGISYYKALLFFDQSFTGYSIDTARTAIKKAKKDFDNANAELKQEVKDDGITPEMIEVLYDKIRDLAFQNTLTDLSPSGISDFQSKFPNSIYEDILTYKLDSMEFQSARAVNAQSALQTFIETHPTSVFKPRADSLLDNLRVEDLEKTGSLKDYYNFLDQYPFTKHRKKLERYILRVSTASHDADAYRAFVQFASNQALKKQAADILFYLDDQQDFVFHPLRDSLREVIEISKTALFPVIERGRYGFHDQSGQLQIDYQYTEIQEDIKCHLSDDSWVYGKGEAGKILRKDGKLLFQNVEDYRSISRDVGLIKKTGFWYLFHKSGFKILSKPAEDAEVISGKWIKVKQGGKWGLVSFTGLTIAESIYDDIFREGTFWVFEKNGLLAVYTERLILQEIEERGLSLEFKFDDIELVNSNALIGFRDGRECLLDSTLSFLIPWGNHEVYPEESGWYLKSDSGYRLYNEAEEDVMDRHYPYLESNAGWLALKIETDWMLIPRKKGLLPSRGYDSIKLVNDYAAILLKENKKKLLFSSGLELELTDQLVATFPGRKEYTTLSSASETTIYNSDGEPVVSGKFESTMFFNDSLIRVQTRGKQGLIKTNGDWVLNPVFDAIDEKDGLILTLINGKIGCYDPVINQLIRTEYEARIERIGKYYLAKKDGKYGVIDFAKSEIISFDYEEISQWNDTSYLVKQDGEYLIINGKEESVFEQMESVKLLVQNDRHKMYQYIKDGRYGLMSSEYGQLLGPEFTDVFNIGSRQDPLFFADQHLDKAGFHVVSYINQVGELILSKAYTREEFDRILCDN
ncbi:MAG: WG repeat-containing protein [Ekhidna sp.]|uniref:WG repeat-containing protein n=1 Tax=Ekhidna sp. TaxID=2608089 RepID=UPI0032EEA4AC